MRNESTQVSVECTVERTQVRVECTGYHGKRQKYRLSVSNESTWIRVECTGYKVDKMPANKHICHASGIYWEILAYNGKYWQI